MKKHRYARVLLTALLILAVFAGVLFLAGEGIQDAGPSESAQSEPLEVTRYRLDYSEESVRSVNQGFERIFLYKNILCQFRLVEDGDDYSVQLFSVTDGTVLETYPSSCFPASVHPALLFLYLDRQGQLWGLGYQVEEEAWIGPGVCVQGAAWPVLGGLEDVPYYAMRSFFVSGEITGVFVRDQGAGALTLQNSSDGSARVIKGLLDYDLDGQGNVYLLEQTEDKGYGIVKKAALRTGEVLWTKTEEQLPGLCVNLACGEQNVYVLCDFDIPRVVALDPETGEAEQEVLNLKTGADLSEDTNPFVYAYSFCVDTEENIAFSIIESGDSQQLLRKTWLFSKETIMVTSSNAVTLTITMPYPVDSIMWGVQLYQRQHPEVQIVWDIPYTSREEFGRNISAYTEQITLRTMTGDTGDLQLVLGNGLLQEVVTDTDAFLDLAPYLEACEYRDDLEWNLLETLRGGDGAIRAVPLGVMPTVYICNMTLWHDLAPGLDPNTVTWSQLLDQALKWHEQGLDYSLTTWSEGQLDTGRDNLLTSILLSNLYGETKSDFGLDTPEVRTMLEKLKTLWETEQLICGNGVQFDTGFLRNTLLVPSVRENCSDVLADLYYLQERDGLELCYMAPPKGENGNGQQGYAYCWGIPAASQHRAAALDLLGFLLSQDGLPGDQYAWNALTLNREVQEHWCENLEKTEGVDFSATMEQLQDILAQPIIRYNEVDGWQQAVANPIREYLNGNFTLDDALAQAKDGWERLMNG